MWNYGKVENSERGFSQILEHLDLVIYIIGNWVCLWIFNYSLARITKYLSWVHAYSITKARPVFVFIFFSFYSWKPIDLIWGFRLWALIVLVLGILIFNEILVIPILELDYNILKNRNKRKLYNRSSEVTLLDNKSMISDNEILINRSGAESPNLKLQTKLQWPNSSSEID